MQTQVDVGAKAKADALLAQDLEVKALVAKAGANLSAQREAAMAEFEALGEALGRSAGSLTIAAMKFARLVGEGTMSVGEGKAAKGDDAETVYLKFVGAFNTHVGTVGIDAMATDAKTPISMFRTFGKGARFHAGDPAFFERILAQHSRCAPDERVSGYNALVSSNRELCKAAETPEFKAASPAAVLANVATDAWVLDRCLKTPAKAKDAAAKMADLIAKLDKLADSMDYAKLAPPLAGIHAWFDAWKAEGSRSVSAQAEFEAMIPEGNA